MPSGEVFVGFQWVFHSFQQGFQQGGEKLLKSVKCSKTGGKAVIFPQSEASLRTASNEADKLVLEPVI